jgi:hypothetical protein
MADDSIDAVDSIDSASNAGIPPVSQAATPAGDKSVSAKIIASFR